ncbi:hypothetical protein PR202_gb17679 [Eleusine coracana subsp. coracana]|uniref:DUF1618 domain-containing protein n=1 Tax=Eleusine coracana subsp. coracana TaxID=191504 RepID=A0AAV5F492_ELECO|nr:hypothetical protein PR202_gb17679 [Eleusine coracana subsp. coracana]
MKVEADPYTGAMLFAVTRFLSETGKWEKVGFAVGIERGLQLHWMMTPDHEVLAFAGRLWWVDVSRGAICFDPFSDQPDFRCVELPRDSVTDCVHTLGRYRRMGVSEGRLRYAEVSREEPFVLRSFVLNNDSGCWALEHRMELSRLWVHGGRQRQEDAPHIAVLDPLNANVIHITLGNVAFAVDMDKGKVLGCSTSPIDEGTLSSVKANVKSNTLSDILVRVDRSKKN